MPSVAQSNCFLRLSLLSPCSTVSLAAPTLAAHLGIGPEDAVQRLTNAPSVLANRLEETRAKRLANLLLAIGVEVRLEPSHQKTCATGQRAAVFDLSIQPIESDNLTSLAEALAESLPANLLATYARNITKIHQALAGPNGLVLVNISSEQIKQTRQALRRIEGLRLATSNPISALHDIFADPREPGQVPKTVCVALQHLGLAPCPLTGALATRVDTRTRDLLFKRFEKVGLIAMNRDFQRFDLFLTGVRNLSPRELADFLIARSDLPRKSLERMSRPLKIETGLTRANALAFQSDYAALGLETCARLRVFHPVQPSSSGWVAP